MMQGRNRIRELRHASGVGLEELAEEIGVHPSTLHRWETGDTKRLPHSEQLEYLAGRFKVTVPFLMGWANGNGTVDGDGANAEGEAA